MMGTKSLDIIAGYGSEYLLSNEVYEGSSLPGFSDLVSNVNRLIDKLDVLINAFGDEDIFVERLDNIIYNADKGLQSMNVLMLDLQKSDLLVAFTELKTASRAIQSLINDNLDKLDGTLDLMTKSFSHLDSLVVRFYSASEKDDNNVGKLLTDDELYTNIVTTTKELEELITDIKKDPKKYFKFSVF
jgi:phospholipid/cholesterol/gamma-HCH transport system substrate-binding protein